MHQIINHRDSDVEKSAFCEGKSRPFDKHRSIAGGLFIAEFIFGFTLFRRRMDCRSFTSQTRESPFFPAGSAPSFHHIFRPSNFFTRTWRRWKLFEGAERFWATGRRTDFRVALDQQMNADHACFLKVFLKKNSFNLWSAEFLECPSLSVHLEIVPCVSHPHLRLSSHPRFLWWWAFVGRFTRDALKSPGFQRQPAPSHVIL